MVLLGDGGGGPDFLLCVTPVLTPCRTRAENIVVRLPLSSGGREEQGRRSKPPLPLSPLASDSWSPPDPPERPRATDDNGGEEVGGAGSAAAGTLSKVRPSTASAAVSAASQPLSPPTDARATFSGGDSLLDKDTGTENEEAPRKGGRSQRGGADERTVPATMSGVEAAVTATVVSGAERYIELTQQKERQRHRQQSAREEHEEEGEEASSSRVAARQLVQSFLASRYTHAPCTRARRG